MILDCVKAYEETFHCEICFNDLSGELARALGMEHGRMFHSNRFCRSMELKDRAFYERCLECELSMCQAAIKVGAGAPLRKLCHAGILELAFPVRKSGELACVMFAGPFRMSQPPGSYSLSVRQDLAQLPKGGAKTRDGLPEASPELIGRAETLGCLLSSEIERLLEREYEADLQGKRPERIKRFFDHSFRRPIGIADLAKELKLSVPRTSQVLRSLFKRGFPEILNAHRLDCAARRLRGSKLSAIAVAKFVGYSSPNYFHRVFKRRFGVTPEEMRSLALPELNELSEIYGLPASEFKDRVGD